MGCEQTRSLAAAGWEPLALLPFWPKADMNKLFLYSCLCHYHRLRSGADMRRPGRAEPVRIPNYSRLLVVLGLCSLANIVGLPVNIGNISFMSIALGQPPHSRQRSRMRSTRINALGIRRTDAA